MAIDYDDLEVGEVYFGAHTLGSTYFFSYLGEGKWSPGTSSLHNKNYYKTFQAYYANTNAVIVFWKVNVFPETGVLLKNIACLVNGILEDQEKPKMKVVEKVKYKVINCHSPAALFKEL